MNEALGVEWLSPSEQSYLQALAEAYHNASSWDTRRQVLSIMTGVASFNDISQYIPGLIRYRFTMAKFHQLQFGRGGQVPQQPTTRIRVDLSQLDHFLGFITSPHLVQDLPFGQKHFKLSSGDLIEVPNVTRLMISQRVVQQYKQYCMETNFKPFRESTIARNRGHFASVINCQQHLFFKMADKNNRSQGKRFPYDILNNLSSLDLFYEVYIP